MNIEKQIPWKSPFKYNIGDALSNIKNYGFRSALQYDLEKTIEIRDLEPDNESIRASLWELIGCAALPFYLGKSVYEKVRTSLKARRAAQ